MALECELRAKRCGGCPLLGVDYARQLQQKEQDLKVLLGKYGPVRPVAGMKQPVRYRNKAIATFAPGRGGRLVTGIYAEGTHKVLPSNGCILQDERLDKAIAATCAAVNACHWPCFEEDKGLGLVRHVVARCGAVSGEIMVVLVTAQPQLPGAKNFVRALLAEGERRGIRITTVVQNYNPRKTSAVLGFEDKTLYGRGFIVDTLCGTNFAIGPRSFYQVNHSQTEVLYGLALEAAGLTGKETVVDAYCGIGTIALTAAPKAKQVYGVEVNEAAVRDAIGNAKHSGIRNARFIAADATEWIAGAAEEGLRADVIFMDPPREGSTPQFLESVARMAPRTVVYVSCGPESLARDLAILTRKGYRVEYFAPVDMFPHTRHVEVVCRLVRREPK